MDSFEIQTYQGTITVQPHVGHVTLLFTKLRFTGISSLMEYMFPAGTISVVARRARTTIMNQLQTSIITSYQKALKKAFEQPTTTELINELSERGVKVADLSIQCQADDCKEECATSNSVLVELGEAAVEAAEIEGFCDERLICAAHKAQEDEERHLEDMAEQNEARKTECHE